jgi:hypothetical protein
LPTAIIYISTTGKKQIIRGMKGEQSPPGKRNKPRRGPG